MAKKSVIARNIKRKHLSQKIFKFACMVERPNETRN